MTSNTAFSNFNPDDYINTTAIFSEIKKTVLSKSFKGGKINNLFGATKLDFTNADLNGMAVIDVSQAFGEIKIRVPDDWRVETEFSNVFTNIDDKRTNKIHINADKLLMIKGVSVCAVIDILNRRY